MDDRFQVARANLIRFFFFISYDICTIYDCACSLSLCNVSELERERLCIEYENAAMSVIRFCWKCMAAELTILGETHSKWAHVNDQKKIKKEKEKTYSSATTHKHTNIIRHGHKKHKQKKPTEAQY